MSQQSQPKAEENSLDFAAYQSIKDHFMTKFANIDEQFEKQSNPPDGETMLTEFIQEGIGALLAYLPKNVAYSTLTDFLVVLRMSGGKAAQSHEQVQKAAAATSD
jgi:dsRNA-specific ribonuclease